MFELTLKTEGRWAEKILHSFNINGEDGYNPYAGLVMDAAGRFYGTTPFGGIHYSGTVFQLTPKAGGGWTETILQTSTTPAQTGFLPPV